MAKQSASHHSTPAVKYKTNRPILLDCPSCKHFISSAQIDLEEGIASCTNCGHTFAFEDVVKADPLRRREVVMPDGVDALKLSSMLDIVVDWYHAAPKRTIATLISGSFFWNIILLPIVIFLALSGDFIFILFFGGHIITGLMLLMYLAATFLNKTHIEVNASGINIRHTPLPMFNKQQHIPVEMIDQLYVSRYTERFHNKKGNGVQAYALSAVLKNRKVVRLLKGMDLETQLYLEQEIETYLEIKDRKVRGEMPRT